MPINLRDRIDTYRMNTGTGWALWNLLILGFVVWTIVRTGNTVLQVFAGAVLASALIAGAIIIPIARRNTRLANRLIQTAQWTAIIMIAVDWTNTVQIPLLGHLGILALIMWSLSASFWFISSPGILTATGIRALHKRAARDQLEHDPALPG